MLADLDHETAQPAFEGRIHPLQLALDVQGAMGDGDWLVIDGGNTHFWSEIAVNIAGFQGKNLVGFCIRAPLAFWGLVCRLRYRQKMLIPTAMLC